MRVHQDVTESETRSILNTHKCKHSRMKSWFYLFNFFPTGNDSYIQITWIWAMQTQRNVRNKIFMLRSGGLVTGTATTHFRGKTSNSRGIMPRLNSLRVIWKQFCQFSMSIVSPILVICMDVKNQEPQQQAIAIAVVASRCYPLPKVLSTKCPILI